MHGAGMPRDVAIIFVHGIHARDAQYSDPMRARILNALPAELQVHAKFSSVFWANIVRDRTHEYMGAALLSTGMKDGSLRRLVVEGLGDAAAYQKTRNRENSAYFKIQDSILATLREAEPPDDPTRPLVLIGHSLGCHILSSLAWDMNRLRQLDEKELENWDDGHAIALARDLQSGSPFGRLGTLAGIVTLGSNMPLFTFMFGPRRVFPITHYPANRRRPAFPGSELPDVTAARARWNNFYSPNDLLGFPLKPLNPLYSSEERIVDHEVHVEGRWRARLLRVLPATPGTILRAHINYWTDPTVGREVAAQIADIMTAEDGLPPLPAWT